MPTYRYQMKRSGTGEVVTGTLKADSLILATQMVREMGGSRPAQLLAAIGSGNAGSSPISRAVVAATLSGSLPPFGTHMTV